MASANSARARNPFTWFAQGGWYFALVLITLGILSPLPFAHAATRLRSPLGWVWPVLYAAAVVGLLAMPNDPDDNTVGGYIIGLIVVALVHLTFLRRRVWPRNGQAPAPAHDDPAVAAALAARARREESRRIVATDPLLARELKIGRPDLSRTYDDGGLVDLNTAPPQAVADACGITLEAAQRIVDARTAAGIPFVQVEDAFTWTDVPVEMWDRIRDRGIVY
jgi:DNA uptake protein ComE-like DNA-binding protein